jgi:hypothetical protein
MLALRCTLAQLCPIRSSLPTELLCPVVPCRSWLPLCGGDGVLCTVALRWPTCSPLFTKLPLEKSSAVLLSTIDIAGMAIARAVAHCSCYCVLRAALANLPPPSLPSCLCSAVLLCFVLPCRIRLPLCGGHGVLPSACWRSVGQPPVSCLHPRSVRV